MSERLRQLRVKAQLGIPFFTIFLAVILVFNGVLQGKIIGNGNYLFAFEPWSHHSPSEEAPYNFVLSDDVDAMPLGFQAAERIRSGDVPFWNSQWQLGIPEFRIDSGWFYPLRVLWVLFGVPYGMTLEVLFRFFLGGCFAFLLLRTLKVNVLLSLFCSIGYIFGSNSLGDYMYGFGPIGLTLPIVLYFLERAIISRRSQDMFLLMCGLVVLNTHIMIHVNAVASIWVAIYAFFRILFEDKRLELYRKIFTTMLFSGLVFSFALLPTLNFYLNDFNKSYRDGYGLAQLHTAGLWTLFYSWFYGHPLLESSRWSYGTYVNLGIFIGFLAGTWGIGLAVLRLGYKRDKFVIPTLVVTVLLALSIYNFSFESVESVFPKLPLLKYVKPFYQKPIFQFFLFVLGSLGLQFFWDLNKSNTTARVLSLAVGVIIFFIGVEKFLDQYYSTGHSALTWRYFTTLTISHLIIVISFILLKAKLFSSWQLTRVTLISIFLGAAIFEGMLNAHQWIPYTKREHWFPPTATTDFLNSNIQTSRVISLDRFAVPGILFGYDVPIAAGRSLPNPKYLELLRLASPEIYSDHPTQSLFSLQGTDLSHPVWDILNVSYFLASRDVNKAWIEGRYGNLVKIKSFSDGTVIQRRYRSKPYLASYVLKHFNTFDSVKESLKNRRSARNFIVTTDENLRGLQPADSSCAGRKVDISNFRSNSDKVSFQVRNDCQAYIALSQFYEKGWTLKINGVEKPLYTAYDLLPLVVVSKKGLNKIELTYVPEGLWLGMIVSLASLLIFLGYLYVESAMASNYSVASREFEQFGITVRTAS